MIKIFQFIILYVISFFLRYFIRINKKVLLFSTQGGRTYEGNAKYLFIYFSLYTDYECIWITKNKNINNQINNEGFKSFHFFSWKTLILSLKANSIFITHSLSDVMPVFYNKNSTIINIWHAIPIKNISFLDQNLNFKSRILDFWRDKRCNYFISNSQSFNKYYLKSFKITSKKIVVGGLPRIDFLKNPDIFIKNLKNPFQENKTVYLYAPTFRDYSYNNPFYESKFLMILEDYLKKKNATLYIKNHPFDTSIPDLDQYLDMKFLGNSIDIYELLPFVDHLICDYSSIIYDFKIAYPEKDIFLYCPDIKQYEKNRGFVDLFKEFYENETRNYLKELKKINKNSAFFSNENIYSKDNFSCKTIFKLIN